MTAAEPDESVHWVRTVGAPHPDDPRDGELHQLFGRLPDSFDLEPWDDELDGLDAHYVRDPEPHLRRYRARLAGEPAAPIDRYDVQEAVDHEG